MVKRTHWSLIELVALMVAVKRAIKGTVGSVSAKQVMYAVPGRTLSAVNMVLARMRLASVGACYRGDCVDHDGSLQGPSNRTEKYRGVLVTAGFVIDHIGQSLHVVQGHRRTHKGWGTSNRALNDGVYEFTLARPNYPAPTKVVLPKSISVSREFDIWSKYIVTRTGLNMSPVQFKTVRRYISGYLKRNTGYEKGGPSHFMTWADKNQHLFIQ